MPFELVVIFANDKASKTFRLRRGAWPREMRTVERGYKVCGMVYEDAGVVGEWVEKRASIEVTEAVEVAMKKRDLAAKDGTIELLTTDSEEGEEEEK